MRTARGLWVRRFHPIFNFFDVYGSLRAGEIELL